MNFFTVVNIVGDIVIWVVQMEEYQIVGRWLVQIHNVTRMEIFSRFVRMFITVIVVLILVNLDIHIIGFQPIEVIVSVTLSNQFKIKN